MNAVKMQVTIQNDGELRLNQLPFRKGDRVEAIVSILPKPGDEEVGSPNSIEDERRRQAALKRFLTRAIASKFRSSGPYPTRDQLHERP